MKQIEFFILVVITAAAVIMSCSGETQQRGEVTLEWWQFWTDPAIKPTIEQMVAEYETANPNIKINLSDLTWANGHEKIVVAFSSGTAPDIIELGSDWVAEFSSADQLADITEMVLTDTAQYNGWSPGIHNDRIYAFPWILGTRVLFINRELMKKAGYDETFLPINWPQLKSSVTISIHLETTCTVSGRMPPKNIGFTRNFYRSSGRATEVS